MQIQFGKTKIEIYGGFMYIQAFGREVFVKRERGAVMPFARRNASLKTTEVWIAGLYVIL